MTETVIPCWYGWRSIVCRDCPIWIDLNHTPHPMNLVDWPHVFHLTCALSSTRPFVCNVQRSCALGALISFLLLFALLPLVFSPLIPPSSPPTPLPHARVPNLTLPYLHIPIMQITNNLWNIFYSTNNTRNSNHISQTTCNNNQQQQPPPSAIYYQPY